MSRDPEDSLSDAMLRGTSIARMIGRVAGAYERGDIRHSCNTHLMFALEENKKEWTKAAHSEKALEKHGRVGV